MASASPVLVLTYDTVQTPLLPEQYEQIFSVLRDDLVLALIGGDGELLSKFYGAILPRDECERLVSDHSSDPRRRAALGVTVDSNTQQGNKKRQRRQAAGGAIYPQRDPARPTDNQPAGARINQGYGNDLSFLPPEHPTICKQACTFTRVIQDSAGTWLRVWKVRASLPAVAT